MVSVAGTNGWAKPVTLKTKNIARKTGYLIKRFGKIEDLICPLKLKGIACDFLECL
jgi:hypothetical protein